MKTRTTARATATALLALALAIPATAAQAAPPTPPSPCPAEAQAYATIAGTSSPAGTHGPIPVVPPASAAGGLLGLAGLLQLVLSNLNLAVPIQAPTDINILGGGGLSGGGGGGANSANGAPGTVDPTTAGSNVRTAFTKLITCINKATPTTP
ncbi:hypothetical protein [Streptomyces sp. A5-4]|uniref:hypothetical protein n=1 Tax=Streptomyces sp. A5-4 TaxID=3384771 RepID=UPI003DA93D74